jgi:hypothetical protein
MKPGPRDIKVFITFTEAEFDLLQDNTYQMAESFGLDDRIARLSGKKPIGFYSWDLDCLDAVCCDLHKEEGVDKDVTQSLFEKITQAMAETGRK